MFHKEGYTIIISSFLIIALIILGMEYYSIKYSKHISTFLLILLVLILQFFRNPKININSSENYILSPADGKIVIIKKVFEPEFFKDERIQVSVFMSPLNVHNNIYPISGEVKYVKYHPGKFLLAWNPKSSLENERNSIVIKNKKVEILCRQIAGFLARRIVCYSKINTKTNAGEELGFIKFGSRVDLFLPIGTKINTKINDKVTAGISVIGTLNN